MMSAAVFAARIPLAGFALMGCVLMMPGCSSSTAGLRGHDVPRSSYAERSERRSPEPNSSASPSAGSTGAASSDASAARKAAEQELGPEVAASMPVIERPAPAPLDPGAEALVDSMLAAMPDRQQAEDGVTHIGAAQIRNQSRCNRAETEELRERFARLLTEAGRDDRVAFTSDANAHVQYQLQGTAYLITADGFDQWELYLSLTPADRHFTLWESNGAVRILRQPRPGQQQVFVPRR